MNKEFPKIKSLVRNAKSALIASHLDPDGDALGSMLALGQALEQLGLAVTCYCADQLPKLYRFLPGSERIKRELVLGQHFDLFFIVDSSDLARIGDKLEPRHLAPVIINIDHHPDNSRFGDINYVMQTSSAAEEIFDLCQYLKVRIDKRLADCLYAALITDTGNFRYENTSAKTFLMAAELLRAGVDTHEITTRIYDTKSISSVKVCARALNEIKFSPDKKVAWTVVTETMMHETGAKSEDLVGIVDRIRAIDGVEVAVVFREDNGRVKINFRAKEKANVSEIARRFGGGGHHKAAGAVVAGETAAVVEKVILEVLKYFRAASFLVE
ncbi:MAG TPA: bifunctional oligoribonuclease/PAP phosphatase NrnA [Candidatus Sulfotelmatobacter sp.]|nr:bifunctional oligoribonuclease/PAP phosphatase NrnA [Candidatus Sulfotelmatobacter sp.]